MRHIIVTQNIIIRLSINIAKVNLGKTNGWYSFVFLQTHIQGLDKIKETLNILASIFERVLNNQNLTYFNAFCLLFDVI